MKFAVTWLPVRAGTDAALAMAMTRVILKEFYLDRQSEYFSSYAKTFTDLPFAVVLDQQGDPYASGRYLRASDLGLTDNNAEWKTVYFDSLSRRFVVPNGSIGFRWGEEGRWNLKPEDSASSQLVDPLLSFADDYDGWFDASFPFFAIEGAGARVGTVPVKKVTLDGKDVFVTTIFDLLVAHLGIDRGQGEEVSRGYDDPGPYTPAWQEAITGVLREDVIRVAREFAENAEKTRWKSMIFLGAGTNHWYHSEMIYRSILNLTTLCGCQGVNGGGWAHADKEKLLDAMRIPVAYLANLLTAGDEAPVRLALRRLLALRTYMRSVRVGGRADHGVLEDAGMSGLMAHEMYRLLAFSPFSCLVHIWSVPLTYPFRPWELMASPSFSAPSGLHVPRGQSLSTRKRAPSVDSRGSYTRFTLSMVFQPLSDRASGSVLLHFS